MTGQMCADAKSPNASVATAQAHGMRLKRNIPSIDKNFQDALDEMETQILVAQAVMRRDLVQLRSRQASNGTASQPIAPIDTTKPDVEMTVDEPSQNGIETAATNGNQVAATATESNAAAQAVDKEPATANHKSTAQAESNLDEKTSNEDIADTDGKSTSADNPIDFDSLFNDDMSIGGTAEETKSESPPKQEINNNTQQTNSSNTANDDTSRRSDFSFEVFNEQNPADDSNKQDDLSSLLPGLESYANEGQDFSMPDFSQNNGNDSSRTISATDNQQQSQQQQQQQNQDQAESQGQGDNQQNDMIFGDLMDFGNDFNNNFGFGSDANNDDSRFDDDFFNVE